MQTYTRLFLSAAFGAITAGWLMNYLIDQDRHTLFSILIYAFGVVLGALLASFVIDPKGTTGVVKKSIATVGNNWVKLTKVVIFSVKVCFYVVASWTLGYAVIHAWLLVLPTSYTKQTDLSMIILGEIITGVVGLMLIVLVGAFRATLIRVSSSFKTNAVVAIFFATPVGAAYALVWLLWQALRRISILIFALATLGVVIAIGLTRCERRTAAMAGAVVGMIVGFFWWNPTLVGLIAGNTATLLHFVTNKFGSKVTTAWGKLQAYWRSKPWQLEPYTTKAA